MTLDLNSLAVETFDVAVEGDPSQWTPVAAPMSFPSDYYCCVDTQAQEPVTRGTEPEAAAATYERICTGTL